MKHYNDNYIIHYGVKGMRWGHRKDITRVSFGDRRRNKKLTKKLNKQQYKDAKKQARARYKKDTKQYYDEVEKLRDKRNEVYAHNEDYANRVVKAYTSGYGANSYTTKAAQRSMEATKAYGNSIADKNYEKARAALDKKYSTVLKQADTRYKNSVSKAKTVYKNNKHVISEGDYNKISEVREMIERKKK